MDFNRFYLLFVLSLLCSQSRAESIGSVFFVDSSSHQFFRKSSSDDVGKPNSIADTEAGAAVSVLLGLAPPSTLSADSSSKLNQILAPNPFQRPRAVFVLEISGVDDSNLLAKDGAIFSSALGSEIVFSSEEAEIQLPDENEVAVLTLDEMAEFNDKDIGNFASWMGGTYLSETGEPLKGELTIPLANGATVKLHMSKKADWDFTLRILSLVHNFRMAIEMHENLSHGMRNPAELLIGSFDGIKVLKEQYGTEGIAQHGMEILLATLSKIYDGLEDGYKGQIVGVIFCYGQFSPYNGKVLNVTFARQRASRWLEETEASVDAAKEVLLVRRTLAWITGIILLISTYLGIHFLLNMPLTRDTLLYSNVKLD